MQMLDGLIKILAGVYGPDAAGVLRYSFLNVGGDSRSCSALQLYVFQ